MKVLTCPGCNEVKVVPRRWQTCSLSCAQRVAKARDPQRYVELRRRAGQARGARSRERSIAHWSKRFPGVPTATCRAIYTAGYSAGDRNGQKRGFQQGVNAASGQRTSA